MGATSTRSSSESWARRSASPIDTMPTCSPSGPTRRTSGTRMRSLMRGSVMASPLRSAMRSQARPGRRRTRPREQRSRGPLAGQRPPGGHGETGHGRLSHPGTWAPVTASGGSGLLLVDGPGRGRWWWCASCSGVRLLAQATPSASGSAASRARMPSTARTARSPSAACDGEHATARRRSASSRRGPGRVLVEPDRAHRCPRQLVGAHDVAHRARPRRRRPPGTGPGTGWPAPSARPEAASGDLVRRSGRPRRRWWRTSAGSTRPASRRRRPPPSGRT